MAVTKIDMIPGATSLSSKSNMNKRWPPLADKSSLPYKLTTLSRQKLAREATAPDPDIRRCLGHFRLHCISMEWAQRDMTTRINSFELEDDDEEESSSSDDCSSSDEEGKEDDKLEDDEGMKKEIDENLQIHFEVSTIQTTPQSTTSTSTEEEKEGLLEKGRNCLEKTVQRNLWPHRGHCMRVRPVSIAG